MPVKKTADNDGILLMIGQLLEATQAASEGLKGLGADVRSNANAIIVAAQTLEQLEESVERLNIQVNDESNPENLLRTNRDHGSQLSAQRIALDELKASVALMRVTVEGLNGNQVARQRGWSVAKKVAVGVVAVLAFVITQLIVLWAAILQAGK